MEHHAIAGSYFSRTAHRCFVPHYDGTHEHATFVVCFYSSPGSRTDHWPDRKKFAKNFGEKPGHDGTIALVDNG